LVKVQSNYNASGLNRANLSNLNADGLAAKD
jgi:hypothetical protein